MSRGSARWMAGVLAISLVTTAIALDVRGDGLNWQAGPLHVSMDMQADRGLAIKFNRFAPRQAPGFADSQPETRTAL